jgi:hypothetical protein
VPAWDEYVVAYKDRAAALEGAPPLGDRAYPVGSSLVLVDGRVRGSWRRTLAGSRVRVSVTFWSPATHEEARAVEAAAERYGRFLGLTADVDTRPRR